MEFLIHPSYPGRKLKKKPKNAKTPEELVYFHKDDFSDEVLGQVEKYTVGLPVTIRDEIVKNIKKDIAATWNAQYSTNDILSSTEEYQELPGAKGLSISAHPLEWIKDPGKIVSKIPKAALESIADFSDIGNDFKWEFVVGPMLEKEGLTRRQAAGPRATIELSGHSISVAGRYIPVMSGTTPDPLATSLREYVRYRSTWPNRWEKGLVPSRAIILSRLRDNLDPADPFRKELEATRYLDLDPKTGAVIETDVLSHREDLNVIPKKISVVNPVKREADYANKVNGLWNKAGNLAKSGSLVGLGGSGTAQGLEVTKMLKLLKWLNQEELANMTNDLVQAAFSKSFFRTYIWRYVRSFKIKGTTVQNWSRGWVNTIKNKVPGAKQLNTAVAKFTNTLGKTLDKVQTVALHKLREIATKLGLEKVLSLAIGGALGAATGGVSVVVGTLVKNIAQKLAGGLIASAWENKGNIFLVMGGCGCLLFASPMLVMIVILSGFKIPMDRVGVGGASPERSLVSIEKSVDKNKFSNEDTNRAVTYTVIIENKSSDSISVFGLTDNKNPTSIQESDKSFNLDASGKKIISYPANVPANISDEAYVNTISGKANVSGKEISLSASAVVIVGSPRGVRPSGWPTSGKITQGPGCSYTHGGYAAVDIAQGLGTSVKATQDGKVLFSGYDGAYGKTVIIENAYAQTRYSHLESLVVSEGEDVYPGTVLGTQGKTGDSPKITGVHLHYEIERLIDFEDKALAWDKRLIKVSDLFFVPETIPLGQCENWHIVSSSY